MPKSITILVVDDHMLIRHALSSLLLRLQEGVTVLTAGDCDEAFHVCERNPNIDCVLLDYMLPGRDGIDALPTFRKHIGDAPVVILSARDDRESVLKALDQGAMGYIVKTSNEEALVAALRSVLTGTVCLPPSVLGASHQTDVLKSFDQTACGRRMTDKPVTPIDLGLTPREADVLGLLIMGKANKVIGRELDIAESTVKVHAQAVCRKMGVTTRTQVILAAARVGLVLR